MLQMKMLLNATQLLLEITPCKYHSLFLEQLLRTVARGHDTMHCCMRPGADTARILVRAGVTAIIPHPVIREQGDAVYHCFKMIAETH